MKIKVVATRDVPEEALRQFRDALSPDFDVDVDGGRVVMLSVEPPSWIHFIAQAEWWVQALAGISTLFVAEIVKEAAKDTWRARAKIISAIAGVGARVRKISDSFVALRRRISSRTEIVIGLPIPDEHFGIHLTLTAVDPDDALEVTWFDGKSMEKHQRLLSLENNS
jgi:hypothetical protein